jgi:hypothetical protein
MSRRRFVTETFCYRRRFVTETFCRGDVLYVRRKICTVLLQQLLSTSYLSSSVKPLKRRCCNYCVQLPLSNIVHDSNKVIKHAHLAPLVLIHAAVTNCDRNSKVFVETPKPHGLWTKRFILFRIKLSCGCLKGQCHKKLVS